MEPQLPVNIQAEASIKHETKKLIFHEIRNEFEVCQPIVREKSEWLGLRRKTIFAHRTADDKWDIRIV